MAPSKYVLIITWQIGFIIGYHNRTIALGIPFISFTYTWQKGSSGFTFINDIW